MKRDQSCCEYILWLMREGWDDGLGGADFRRFVGHLAECAECISRVRSWSWVDTVLAELARILDQTTPRTAIAERVWQVLARERMTHAAEPSESAEAELTRFLERLSRETWLLGQLAQIADVDALLNKLVTLGRVLGFRFSEAVVRLRLAQQQAAHHGELTDAQLEAVAAGASVPFVLLQELIGLLPPGGGSRQQ